MKTRADKIRKYLIEKVPAHPQDIVAKASEHFGVTRMTIHRHLETLIKRGKILKSGTTRNTSYHLNTQINKELTFSIKDNLNEFSVWDEYLNRALANLKDNINDICCYGFTEMFNNAIDHANAKKINVFTNIEDGTVIIKVIDDGIGIFKKIAQHENQTNMRESITALTTGKFTTDPKNHTGQGIFFTSRVFDAFILEANGLMYKRDNIANDWSFQTIDSKTAGTSVSMTININSSRDIQSVFRKHQDNEDEDLPFDRTEIKISMLELTRDGDFISRAQAKLITDKLDPFKRVTLDFSKVKTVGQGFVDEIFRVYQNQRPELKIHYINANEDIEFMIKRCLTASDQQSKTT